MYSKILKRKGLAFKKLTKPVIKLQPKEAIRAQISFTLDNAFNPRSVLDNITLVGVVL